MDSFYIKLVGVSKALGPRRCGDFRWSSARQAHIYQGEDFPLEQFNEIVPAVMERYKSYMPRLPQPVLVLDEPAPAPAAEPEAAPVTPQIERPEGAPPLEPDAPEKKPARKRAAKPADDTAPSGG